MTDPAATAIASSPADEAVEPSKSLGTASDLASASLDTVRPGDPGGIVPSPDGGPTASEAPLLFWMQGHVATALRRSDLVTLGAALDELATFAPKDPAYANWASIAKDGADAARAGSLDGAKAACRGCHTQCRSSYKAAMRARRLP
jgi:hypothetical protein